MLRMQGKRDFSWLFGALVFGKLQEKQHNFNHTVSVQVKVVLWVSMHKCMVIGCKNIFQERKLARFESSGLSVHIKVETVFLNCSILQFFNYFGMSTLPHTVVHNIKNISLTCPSIGAKSQPSHLVAKKVFSLRKLQLLQKICPFYLILFWSVFGIFCKNANLSYFCKKVTF